MKNSCDLSRGGGGVTELHTERLLLRQWRDADLEVWAELNADPETMRYFPARLTREQSDAAAERIQGGLQERGWGLWAVEVTDPGEGADPIPFIGFVGIQPVPWEPSSVEIGWRLHRSSWGNGYATEAATAALNFAFRTLELDEVVSFAVTTNDRSRRVMERLGMTHDPDRDFDHPRIDPGPIRRHAFYRLPRSAWNS